MHIETQFSIFMVNKPGVLAKILDDFAKAKINIVAVTIMDSVEHGVMRVVALRASKVREVIKAANLPFDETSVLCLNLANKSGALGEVAEKLSRHHINISYAYCTAGARGGRTTGVIKVADVRKAIHILESGGQSKRSATKSKPAVRRSVASRK